MMSDSESESEYSSSATSSPSQSSSNSSRGSRSEEESDSDGGWCPISSKSCGLRFDIKSIEKLILSISDRFNFRVVMSDEKTRTALLLTTGLTIAGGLIGRHYGGKIGAAMGGAVGGACGVGIVMVSMRSVWSEIKDKLQGLHEIVFNYLSGMGLSDYVQAGKFLSKHINNTQLAMIILKAASGMLGKKIVSSITSS